MLLEGFAVPSNPQFVNGVPYYYLLQSHLGKQQAALNSYPWWWGGNPKDPVNGPANSAANNLAFPNTYSSYSRDYNYYGYTNKSVTLYIPAAAGANPYNFSFPFPTATLPVETAENLSYVYEWYRYDAANQLNFDHLRPMNNAPDCYVNFECVGCTLGYNLARQVYWSDYNPTNTAQDPAHLQDRLGRPLWDVPEDSPAQTSVPDAIGHLAPYMGFFQDGVYGAVFPGLCDRNAPDNTIVTRCPNHRKMTMVRAGGKDLVLRLDGSVSLIPVLDANYDWARQEPPRRGEHHQHAG